MTHHNACDKDSYKHSYIACTAQYTCIYTIKAELNLKYIRPWAQCLCDIALVALNKTICKYNNIVHSCQYTMGFDQTLKNTTIFWVPILSGVFL